MGDSTRLVTYRLANDLDQDALKRCTDHDDLVRRVLETDRDRYVVLPVDAEPPPGSTRV